MTARLGEGGLIDRSRPIHFTFNGTRYSGFQGDTLASALLANGVRLIARSFKYHRPRGLIGAGGEDPCGLVQLEDGPFSTPNLRVTEIELYDGLSARSVNAWPSVRFDIGVINNLLSSVFVAGFYYKTFMHPQSFWMRYYEPLIRRLAGMGRAPETADPEAYDHRHARTDLLIIGAGPAGLSAALAAAGAGLSVMILDEGPHPGGLLPDGDYEIDGRPGREWLKDQLSAIAAHENIALITRTTLFGLYDQNFAAAVERVSDHLAPQARQGAIRQRLWWIRARHVLIATGAHERPLVFEGNDRPGVMLASAVRSYLKRFAVRAGRQAVLFANNDNAWHQAFDCANAGLNVTHIVDIRRETDPALQERAAALGIGVFAGYGIRTTHGGRDLSGVEIAPIDENGIIAASGGQRIACDLLMMSGGWNPAVHLFSQAQGKLAYDDARACFIPDTIDRPVSVIGAASGRFTLGELLPQAVQTAERIARDLGYTPSPAPIPDIGDTAREGDPAAIRPLWQVDYNDGRRHKAFVDLQNDVTADDIALAAREGYKSVEHVKRYTTTGMGTDQGRTSNVNALALLAAQTGRSIPETGTTTFRPPYAPVTFGALAGRAVGRLVSPLRRTALDGWHERAGAVFENVGQWRRPYCYPHPGETEAEAVARECLAVRRAAGIIDASTLGKIEVHGPDAGEFLNRFYVNGFKKLGLHRCRYGLMCHEDGHLFDDGVVTRLAEGHYYLTTTTGNAAAVFAWFEDWLQSEWPELKVYVTSVTEAWSTLTLTGPKARGILASLCPALDLSDDSFPHMSMRNAEIAGTMARIFRISFTGEISYEINIPWHEAEQVWDAVLAAGTGEGLTPYGTEAMHVLRAEKGYIIIGQDTDGEQTPADMGYGRMVSTKKHFIGSTVMFRGDNLRADRRQLVGLATADDNPAPLEEGGQISPGADTVKPVKAIGHVTSSYASPHLNRPIALALVAGGRNRMGETVYIHTLDGVRPARIVAPVFYDEEGKRLHD